MAEIPIARKTGSRGWLWALLALAAVALLWWLLTREDRPAEPRTTTGAAPARWSAPPAPPPLQRAA